MIRMTSPKIVARTPEQLLKGILRQKAQDQLKASGELPAIEVVIGGKVYQAEAMASLNHLGRIMYHWNGKTVQGNMGTVKDQGNRFTDYYLEGFNELISKYLPADRAEKLFRVDSNTTEPDPGDVGESTESI